MANASDEALQGQLVQERAETKIKESFKKTKKKAEAIMGATGANINIAEWMIVLLAVMLADAIDAIELTGALLLIAKAIDFIILVPVWLFIMIKLGQRPAAKKDAIFKMFLTFIGELLPFIGILPFWTCYIIYLWLKQTKLGRKTIARGVKKIRAKK